MDHPAQNERQAERQRLEAILVLLRQRLARAKEESARQMEGLGDIRRDEFQERSEPVLRNLWAAHRFEDLVHLSQEFQNAAAEEKDHETTLRLISSLEKMAESPYFARIDLRFEEDEEPERVYIGRHSLWDDDKENLLIYDWRAPIASVFYRYGTGPASYAAPAGRINCELLLKRQFEIQRGELIGYFDLDTVVQDSFLRRLLAQNASAQMKAIVETIQKDQDTAIRDEDHDLLMVQGAAGSGKTSIAMHRTAYLMYEGLKNPLKPHNILILSPNEIFEKYISGVLPELGEKSVRTTTLEQLLEDLLDTPVESRADRWEALCAADPVQAEQRKAAMAFKSSHTFLKLLERYARALPRLLPCQDLSYAGQIIAGREEIRACMAGGKTAFPLAVRLRRLESMLWERVHSLRPARLDALRMLAFRLGRGEEYARGCSIWESGVLARTMQKMTRLDVRALYEALLRNPALLKTLGQGLSLPQGACFPPPDPASPLPLEDAAAVAYLKLLLTFGSFSGDIRQVVVDEGQDYGPVDYAVLGRLFPKARFTVVGDVCQTLERKADQSLYGEISDILSRKNPVLLELTKSFRCTKEILDFSVRLMPEAYADSLNRRGDDPQVLPSSRIGREIDDCLAKGYESIALITKTMADAEAWKEKLSFLPSLPIMGRSTRAEKVFLCPLPLAKGLEFDAVLILDCDEKHYGRDEDRNLLYVACTRALHRLAVFADGPVIPLIRKEAPNA